MEGISITIYAMTSILSTPPFTRRKLVGESLIIGPKCQLRAQGSLTVQIVFMSEEVIGNPTQEDRI